MKFGKVDDPGEVDFYLPPTQKQTIKILKRKKKTAFKNVRIGCAKWNRADLKNFYPRGITDELEYYASQFNSIELNASFYRMFPEKQFKNWAEKVGKDFQFFPKIPRIISHIKRLKDTERLVDDFVTNISPLKKKLGMVFLQLREDFKPNNMDRLVPFFNHWPPEIPLAAEFRHSDWFTNEASEKELLAILEEYKITNIITDSAGRRDLLHMSLTTDSAFIRYNGANHPTDFSRLDDWLDRIEEWHNLGLKNVYFFVHQNIEKSSPLLSSYFIEKFNKRFDTQIKIPETGASKT